MQAVVLDLDGVITDTRSLHIRAWTQTFNDFLSGRKNTPLRPQEQLKPLKPLKPFDPLDDYSKYVDGKPREDGIRSFLASRGLTIPEGQGGDTSDTPSIHDLAQKKNHFYLALLETEGAHVYPDAIEVLSIWHAQHVKLGVVTSSRNCARVLQKAGIQLLFAAQVDGGVGKRLGLRGKPEPDYFLEAARRLRVNPSQTLVIEDAESGVEAGKRGGFGGVIGLDRSGQHAQALLEHGADCIFSSLTHLLRLLDLFQAS